jgi:RNA polymerase sigma-70 factor (ECF subfamily)
MKLFSKNYQALTDEELMALVAKGRQEAFSVIYSRYSKRLHYFFFRMLGKDEEKAQDFLHDLFMKIIEKPYLFDTSKKFSTWVYVVASNMCKNEYRKQSVRKFAEDFDFERVESSFQDIVESLDQKTFSEHLSQALEQIDERHRTIFVLRFQECFSIKEIADILDISEGTVKSRIFYSVRKLANKLNFYNPKLNEQKIGEENETEYTHRN